MAKAHEPEPKPAPKSEKKEKVKHETEPKLETMEDLGIGPRDAYPTGNPPEPPEEHR